MCKEYNGYTNYQTWAVSLWLDNDEYLYRQIREWVDEAKQDAEEMELDAVAMLKDRIKEFVEESNPIDVGSGMFSDLLGHALGNVNWFEIAENALEE